MWYSSRLFWSGVPVSATRRFVRMRLSASWRFDLGFLIVCASSRTTTSGPGSWRQRRQAGFGCGFGYGCGAATVVVGLRLRLWGCGAVGCEAVVLLGWRWGWW